MPPNPPDRTIHLTATDASGDVLAVVSYADGRSGITRNGQPVPEMEWDAKDLAKCTAVFARLAGLLK